MPNFAQIAVARANANAGCADSTLWWLKTGRIYAIIVARSNER